MAGVRVNASILQIVQLIFIIGMTAMLIGAAASSNWYQYTNNSKGYVVTRSLQDLRDDNSGYYHDVANTTLALAVVGAIFAMISAVWALVSFFAAHAIMTYRKLILAVFLVLTCVFNISCFAVFTGINNRTILKFIDQYTYNGDTFSAAPGSGWIIELCGFIFFTFPCIVMSIVDMAVFGLN